MKKLSRISFEVAEEEVQEEDEEVTDETIMKPTTE